jgi:hypothetical protein
MPATRNHSRIGAARANALFVSALQRSEQPGARQVRQAIATTLRRFGDRGCTERVAQEFGEHPELAVPRMRWTRQAVAAAYSEPMLRQPGAGRAGDEPEAGSPRRREGTKGSGGLDRCSTDDPGNPRAIQDRKAEPVP